MTFSPSFFRGVGTTNQIKIHEVLIVIFEVYIYIYIHEFTFLYISIQVVKLVVN